MSTGAQRNTSMLCGHNCTLCINYEDSISSFGYADYGAHGHEEDHIFPPKIISSLKNILSIAVGDEHSICIDIIGSVFKFGFNRFGKLGIGS